MSKSYSRHIARGSWSESALKQAIDDVQEGRALKTCAREYGIPANILRRHVNNSVAAAGILKLGRCPLLGTDAEKDQTGTGGVFGAVPSAAV